MNKSNRGNDFNTAENNRLIMQMPNIRVFYQKIGRAKYISHLDITRCMQRALKRAKLPVWYTQGFNPHMYMTFALPLSLGYESECECMDLRMCEEIDFLELQTRLNEALPRDIIVTNVALQENKPKSIVKAKYEVTFSSDEFASEDKKEEFCKLFDKFITKEDITVLKHTKKGDKSINIASEFESLGHVFTANENSIVYTMMFTAGQKNFNPTLLTDLFVESEKITGLLVSVMRKNIYMENGSDFC